MFGQRLDMFSVHTHRLNNSIYTLYKTEKSCDCDDGYEPKASMHTLSVNVVLSDSMERLVQLAKKSVIKICRVGKQNQGWQTADSSCSTKLMTPISNRLWFQNLKIIL